MAFRHRPARMPTACPDARRERLDKIMIEFRKPRHLKRWLIAAVAAVAVGAVGIPFAYIHFFSGSTPAALSLTTAGNGAGQRSGAKDASVSGTWKISQGSQAGYRVQEVLVGQPTTAVGRTTSVTGSLTISGTTLTATTVDVDLRTVKSDKSVRDAQFQGRIMNTASYPTATFTLTKPVDLAPIPAAGAQQKYTAQGNLTMHGQTHPASFQLTAERTDSGLAIAGDVNITFATWGIANPSYGSFVTTGDTGIMEFQLQFARS